MALGISHQLLPGSLFNSPKIPNLTVYTHWVILAQDPFRIARAPLKHWGTRNPPSRGFLNGVRRRRARALCEGVARGAQGVIL